MMKLFTAPLLQMWPWVTSVWSGLTASCSLWWRWCTPPPVCEPTVHCVVYPLLFEPTVQSTVGSNNNRYKHYILIWTQLFIIPSRLANYLPYQVDTILISCWVTIILMKELRKFIRFIDFFTCKNAKTWPITTSPCLSSGQLFISTSDVVMFQNLPRQILSARTDRPPIFLSWLEIFTDDVRIKLELNTFLTRCGCCLCSDDLILIVLTQLSLVLCGDVISSQSHLYDLKKLHVLEPSWTILRGQSGPMIEASKCS